MKWPVIAEGRVEISWASFNIGLREIAPHDVEISAAKPLADREAADAEMASSFVM